MALSRFIRHDRMGCACACRSMGVFVYTTQSPPDVATRVSCCCSDDGDEDSMDGDDEESDEEEEQAQTDQQQAMHPPPPGAGSGKGAVQTIHDMTETDMVNLRRTIYLTIMSSLDFEEAGHKLMKMRIPDGCEKELCAMLIECCSQVGCLADVARPPRRMLRRERSWANALGSRVVGTVLAKHDHDLRPQMSSS
jgi:hypothetical protein